MRRLLICMLLACNVKASESNHNLKGNYQCIEKEKVGIDTILPSGKPNGDKYKVLTFQLLVQDNKIELRSEIDSFVPITFTEKDSIVIKPRKNKISVLGDFVLALSEETGRMFRMSDNEFTLTHSYIEFALEGAISYKLLSTGYCIKF